MMETRTYTDYEQEYNSHLSRVRSVLASSNRSKADLNECERLLGESRSFATAMQGLAEVEGDAFKVQSAKQLVEREVAPLLEEVTRASREGELFGYNTPAEPGTIDPFGPATDTDALIHNSEALLLESQALCAESEQIGDTTLNRMGMQREQLQIASDRLEGTANIANQARYLMKSMGRRAFRNKLFLYCVIILLVCANLAMLYRLLFKKHH